MQQARHYQHRQINGNPSKIMRTNRVRCVDTNKSTNVLMCDHSWSKSDAFYRLFVLQIIYRNDGSLQLIDANYKTLLWSMHELHSLHPIIMFVFHMFQCAQKVNERITKRTKKKRNNNKKQITS